MFNTLPSFFPSAWQRMVFSCPTRLLTTCRLPVSQTEFLVLYSLCWTPGRSLLRSVLCNSGTMQTLLISTNRLNSLILINSGCYYVVLIGTEIGANVKLQSQSQHGLIVIKGIHVAASNPY